MVNVSLDRMGSWSNCYGTELLQVKGPQEWMQEIAIRATGMSGQIFADNNCDQGQDTTIVKHYFRQQNKVKCM